MEKALGVLLPLGFCILDGFGEHSQAPGPYGNTIICFPSQATRETPSPHLPGLDPDAMPLQLPGNTWVGTEICFWGVSFGCNTGSPIWSHGQQVPHRPGQARLQRGAREGGVRLHLPSAGGSDPPLSPALLLPPVSALIFPHTLLAAPFDLPLPCLSLLLPFLPFHPACLPPALFPPPRAVGGPEPEQHCGYQAGVGQPVSLHPRCG